MGHGAFGGRRRQPPWESIMRELGLRKKDLSCVAGLKGLAARLRLPQDRKIMEQVHTLPRTV